MYERALKEDWFSSEGLEEGDRLLWFKFMRRAWSTEDVSLVCVAEYSPEVS